MVKHRLTTYIIILNEMANIYNKFAICKACKEAISQEYTYSNKIVNTKKYVKAHLLKCTHFFHNMYKKILSIAQIKGVLNQAHRNQEIEMIKNMYYSSSAKISIEPEKSNELEELNELEEFNKSSNSDFEDFESEDMTSDANYKSEIDIEENNDLQNDDNISNNSASFSVNHIHSQKDPNTK
ncbi:9857_t:CDS:2 [Racocetra persica]|uniref:9857_t:CDS:1 n=1 Tax=Racocetra persica TaxID=160502 RepID=A0ACA9LXF1_9GLOM|nr:9857_t:CDS:2 [Racocetra persica]